MCGIAGLLSSNHLQGDELTLTNGKSVSLRDTLNRMLAHIHHRGPDDQDLLMMREANVSVGLANTRLAIIDLSAAGHMPMQDSTTKSCITYNGEIYNYKLLRRELDINEADWHSQTDTEVLLKAYQHWGLDFIEKLRGMFAFALWDNQKKELILARDQFGMKPLYYYHTNQQFLFASELRSLLSSGLIAKELDSQGLASFLRFGAVESPRTIIKGVRSLTPGHFLTIKRGKSALEIEEKPYVCDLSEQTTDTKISDRNEAVAILREKLEESVRLHLISDVPLAAFLSGGIDSSAIVALMNRVSSDRLKTFTVVFAEEQFNEAAFAKTIAQQYGTDHQEILLSENDLLQLLPQALAAMDQPTIDGINTYVISKAVKEAGITVALSGLGSDELFGGYPSFRRARRLQSVSAIPKAVRKAVARTGQTVWSASVGQRKAWQMLGANGTPKEAYDISRTLFSADELPALLGKDKAADYIGQHSFASTETSSLEPLNAISVYELQGYMANMLLRDTDQMSMAHSLEVRVPFVDKEIVNYVLSLNGEWKLNDQKPKPLLLDALGDLLPEEIWRRPKMGFTLPFAQWMRSSLQAQIDESINGNLAGLGLGEYRREVWQTFKTEPQKERWARSWSLHVLSKWCAANGVRL